MNKAGRVGGWVAVFLLCAYSVLAQGSLEPASSPAASMRTLDQLYDNLTAAQSQLLQLQGQVDAMSNQLAATEARVVALASSQSYLTRTPMTSLVATNMKVRDSACLALTPQDDPVVGFIHTNASLYYAAWNGADWIVHPVYSANPVAGKISMALQPGTGYPAMSFQDAANFNLMYAGWNGSSWVIHTVAQAGDVGRASSLKFNASGNPAISYYDGSNGRIQYAGWNGSSWVLHTLETEVGIDGTDTALVFMNGGYTPAIAFYDPPAFCVRFAVWNGTGWTVSTIDQASYDNSSGAAIISLALAGTGEPAAAYHDGGAGLRYAEYGAGTWTAQTVDSAAGGFASLAFNSKGTPGISYCATVISSISLKYAEWAGAAWQHKTAYRSFSGMFSSLVFTPLDHPLISHGHSKSWAAAMDLLLTEILPAP